MPLELIVEAPGRIGFAPYADREPVTADKDLYLAETLDLLAAIHDDRPAAVPIEEDVRTLDYSGIAMWRPFRWALARSSSASTGFLKTPTCSR